MLISIIPSNDPVERRPVDIMITEYDDHEMVQSRREILLVEMADNAYHVKTVKDFDAADNLLVQSEFKYRVEWDIDDYLEFLDGGRIPIRGTGRVTLEHIVRTAANGEQLSETRLKGAGEAVISIHGEDHGVNFESLEELLDKIRELEMSDAQTIRRYYDAQGRLMM